MAEENSHNGSPNPVPTFVDNIHLLGIQKALSTGDSSERIKIWQQLEATLNRFKPDFETVLDVTNIPNGSDVTKDTKESPESNYMSLSPPAQLSEEEDKDKTPPDISGTHTAPPNDSSNECEHLECNHKSPHDKSNKHCTHCGKLRKKEDSEVIDLDSDSNNPSQIDENTVLCCSESSEADINNDQLNIEYVSASQEEIGSPDLLAKSRNKQLRDITIAITKSNLTALKKSMPNSVLNSETSNPYTSSPDSPRDEEVHVEFEIGAEISVPSSSSVTSSSKCSSPPPKQNPSPTRCYSSPLSKRAPAKRAHSGTRLKGECTCCHQTTIHSAMKFTTHPWLGVLICQKCYVFINSGGYTIEDGKEIFCRWCGDGGEIANCGSCEKSFCKYCLNSNLGDSTWDTILQDDNWKCYFCDRKPIQHLIDECNQLLQERSEREKLAKKEGAINRKTRRQSREARNESGVEEPYSSDTTQMSVSESVETAVTPVKPISPILEKDLEVSTAEMCSDIDTDSLSLSDLDLLEPKENKRKRVRTPTLSESDNDSDKKLSDLPKPKKPVQSPKQNKPVSSKPKSKKIRVNPFPSSGDEASKEVTLLPVDKEGSEGDSDLFEATRMDQYEYQVGSEDEQSSSECSESELKVKKRKRETRRTKQKNSEEELERSLRKGLKSRLRGKRKAKLISDSSASASSSSEYEESEEEKGKKKGRKKIRKLISDYKLSQSTREAEQAEKERLQRLDSNRSRHSTSIDPAEEIFLSDDSQDEGSVEPLVLEKGADLKSSLCVPWRLVKQLKPHQKDGVLFLWESVCESMERLRGGEGSGALLAHCMGLGKTIQVITLLDTLLKNSDKTGITKVLIINPVNVLYNWKTEFDKWVPERDYFVHILESKDVLKTRIKTMEFWDREGGILLSGYDMFRNFCVGKKIKGKKKNKVFEMLVDPGAQIVVCDEGHVMRNSKSGLSKCLNLINTRRRIVLTGTPLQNNLQEYYCMTNFIKPNLLGSQTEFTNRFANPITNGQHADSTPGDVRIMKQRAHILHVKLKGCVQRQDYTALTKYLPPKHEYVLSARLTNLQINLYEAFLASLEKMELFPVYTVTRRIWSHPWILKKEQLLQRTLREKRMEDDEMSDFIVSNTDDGDSYTENKVKRKKLELLPRRQPQEKRNSKRTADEKNRQFREYLNNMDDIISIGSSSSKEDDDYEPDDVIIESKPMLQDGNGDVAEELISDCSENEADEPKDWFDEFITPEIEVQLEHSAKLLFLFELLKEAKKLNEKVLVFSQSLQMLDLIEYYLRRQEHAWIKGVHYYRMDGSTPIDARDASSSIFNNPKHPKVRLFLISTKAGSLGINLIAANRVVIMDASWNPTHDTQSIFRVYRFGQVKPVFVYRLIAKGTMEEKIYDRQVTKESLALRVIDEQQIGRHFTSSDLAELFRFEPDDIRYHETKQEPEPDVKPVLVDEDLDCVEIIDSTAPGSSREAGKRPDADLVLCSILDKLQPRYLVDYHEHDSLTEHIFDEELSEEEKKAAWDSYNTSKETISREYVQQMWQDKQAQLNQQQQQFELARQLLSQGAIPQTPDTLPRPPVPPIHQILASSSNQSVGNKLQHQVLREAVIRYQAIVANNPTLGDVEKRHLFDNLHLKLTEEFSDRNLQQFNFPRPMTIRPMPVPVPVQVPRGTTHIHPGPANMIITRRQLPPPMARAPVPIMRPMPRGFPVHYPALPPPPPVPQMLPRPPIPQMLPRPPVSSQQVQNQGRVTKTAVANERSYPSFQEQTYSTPIEGVDILPSELIMEHSYLPDN